VNRFLLIALLFLVLHPTNANASTIDLPHFSFHLTEGSAGAARRLAEVAEHRYELLCVPIGACDAPQTPIDVWLAEDAEAFAAAFPDGSPMSEWAVGVTFVDKNRIVLRAHGSALFSLLETFDHELSHALVHAMVPRDRIPRWFSEGVAIWQSGEAVMKRLMEAQHAALTSNLLPLSSLVRSFPAQGPKVSLAYAQSALFLRYLERHFGIDALPTLMRKLKTSSSFDTAFMEVYGAPVSALEGLWAEELDEGSVWILLARDPNLLWGGMSLLFVLASWVKIRRRREALQELAKREAVEREVRRSQQAGADRVPEPVLH
jgi:hypothetical protein